MASSNLIKPVRYGLKLLESSTNELQILSAISLNEKLSIWERNLFMTFHFLSFTFRILTGVQREFRFKVNELNILFSFKILLVTSIFDSYFLPCLKLWKQDPNPYLGGSTQLHATSSLHKEWHWSVLRKRSRDHMHNFLYYPQFFSISG